MPTDRLVNGHVQNYCSKIVWSLAVRTKSIDSGLHTHTSWAYVEVLLAERRLGGPFRDADNAFGAALTHVDRYCSRCCKFKPADLPAVLMRFADKLGHLGSTMVET